MTEKYTDLKVRVGDPGALDATLKQLPGAAAVVGYGMPGGPAVVDGCYVVRVFGDPGFVRFAMQNQGYAEVVGETTALRAVGPGGGS